MKMNWLSILVDFTGLGSWWGLVLGLPVGATFVVPFLLYSPLFAFIFALVCAVAGAIFGVFIGGLNGFGLALITLMLRRFSYTAKQYRVLMLISAGIMTFLLTYDLISGLTGIFSASGRADLIFVITPVIGTTIAAGYASQKMAAWYLKNENLEKKKRDIPSNKLKREEYSEPHPSLSEILDKQEHQQQHIHTDKHV